MRFVPKKIENAKHLIKDLVDGDDVVLQREDYMALNNAEIRKTLKTMIEDENLSEIGKKYLLQNLWKINYRLKPPTMEEFLSEEWLGPSGSSEFIWEHVRDILCQFWSSDSPYRNLILASAIGVGKSTISVISLLYILTHLSLMRNPKKFFGLTEARPIIAMMISFTIDKAKQFLKPIRQILVTSPKYKNVKYEQDISKRQEEYPDKIVWSTASKMSNKTIQFFNDVHVTVASHPADLLGLDIIAAVLSEISFFMEKGFSADYIFRIFDDTKKRIYSRFYGKYFSTCILDSSPNSLEESPIDRYVFLGEADKDPLNFIVSGAQWEFRPQQFEEWFRTGKHFVVYKGFGSKPPKILNKDEIKEYDPSEIIEVPIDVKQLYLDNPIKFMKDYAGYPAGRQDKLIPDITLIESIFDKQLKNIYSYIEAPASKSPTRLIWNEIYNKFFIQIQGRYYFYRSPHEIRYLHIDQSESGDMTGISMVHPELNADGKIVIIADFTIALNPLNDKINLESIFEFLIDLRNLGNINIGKVTFDRFQSSNTIQRLKFLDFPVDRFSVDLTVNPYYIMINKISTGLLRCGRNIILKNNLRSLQEVKTKTGKRKIDHIVGKIDKTLLNDDWDISILGYYAKDLSDSLCGAAWACIHDFTGVPKYAWEDAKDLFDENCGDKSIVDIIERQAYKDLEKNYNLVPENY